MRILLDELAFWIRKILPPGYIGKEPVEFSIESPHASEGELLASHGGNIGDVVYSCLFLKSYWQHTGKKIKLHLHTDVPAKYRYEHPLKNIRMNMTMAKQLTPLLYAQPYISEVSLGPSLPRDVTLHLDAFRELPIDLRCGLIQGWQQLCTDMWLNIFDPWITADKLPEYKETIVVSRTARLCSDYINYKFLNEFAERILFIGVPEECERFKSETAINCSYLTATSFDSLANIINSCLLFVGNQGFPYTVAESVKCARVLESNSIAPNNYPMSSNGRIAIFQKQFESFVRAMVASEQGKKSNVV